MKTALQQLLLKASAEADESIDRQTDEEAADSGYGTLDPAEMDNDEETTQDDPTEFKRPKGVGNADWRVYEVVRDALAEFNEKYKAMWA